MRLSSSPRSRRGTVLPAEHPDEVRSISVPHALSDDVDHLVGVKQEPPSLGHSPADNPLAGTAPGGLRQSACDVRGTAPNRGGHVVESQAPKTVALDEAEAVGHDAAPCGSAGCRRAGCVIDLVQDQGEETPLNGVESLTGTSRLAANLFEFSKEPFEESVASGGDVDDRCGPVAHSLEGLEKGCCAIRGEAGYAEGESPVLGAPRFQHAMGLTRWHQQNVAFAEVPFSVLLHTQTTARVEREGSMAVRNGSAAGSRPIVQGLPYGHDGPPAAGWVVVGDGSNVRHAKGLPWGMRSRKASVPLTTLQGVALTPSP